ncbi:type 1 glutamine amidotransferase domain-containing protein [bacterium]|nr:MAG: type 1 glutamine amidotransferase domain-containing protein [bacterium]
MKTILIYLSLFFPLCVSAQHKILIVSTNRDSVGVEKSGTYLKEIANPFRYFKQQGFEIDIVTPYGGQASIYGEVTNDLMDIVSDSLYIKKVSNTLSPSEVNYKEYVAVFYPGGHGQYFDVVNDERIATITSKIHENGGVIGTAGHGVASLINVILSNGEYLVKGKTITCFPTWAEKEWMNISGYGKYLHFDMQEVLARRGANLIVSPTKDTYKEKSLTMIVDEKNNMVTGAFAFNATWVAEQMTILINRKYILGSND